MDRFRLSSFLAAGACAVACLLVPPGALAQGASALPPTSAPGGLPRAPAVPRSLLPSHESLDLSLPGIDPRRCGGTPHSALCAQGRWTHFANLEVRASAAGFQATYVLEIAANGELHATYRETARGKTRGGEIVLVGMDGFAFRTRETFPPDAPVADIMTGAPLMTAELVALLLDQGVIGPPSDVTEPHTIEAGSDTQFIRASGPDVATLYGPPWRMNGTVRPGSRARAIAFDLRLSYRPVDAKGKVIAGRTDTLRLEGNIDFTPRRGSLPETLDITGFTLMRGDTKVAPQPTLGDARKAVGS